MQANTHRREHSGSADEMELYWFDPVELDRRL